MTTPNPKTNYRLRDGDRVRLLQPARVDGYVYDPVFAPFGTWDHHFMLAGCEGVVIRARTPAVHSIDGRARYFANIDIPHNGQVSRVRLEHDQFRRLP